SCEAPRIESGMASSDERGNLPEPYRTEQVLERRLGQLAHDSLGPEHGRELRHAFAGLMTGCDGCGRTENRQAGLALELCAQRDHSFAELGKDLRAQRAERLGCVDRHHGRYKFQAIALHGPGGEFVRKSRRSFLLESLQLFLEL